MLSRFFVFCSSAVVTMWMVITVLLCACSSLSAQEPVLDRTPINVTATQGQTAVLPCIVRNKGEYKVAWFRERTTLTLDERRTVMDERIHVRKPYLNQWNLHITNVLDSDENRYQCIVNTIPAQRKSVYLTVVVPPFITNSSQDTDVLRGQDVVLYCYADGDNQPQITWFRRNLEDRRRERVGRGNEYTLRNVQKDDQTIYECVATSDIPPSASRRIRVNVVYKPEVTVQTQQIGQHVGLNTSLCCDVSANPPADMDWRLSGLLLSEDERHSFNSNRNNEGTITHCMDIESLTVQDFGNYRCIANNTYGTTMMMVNLQFMNIIPTITIPNARVGKMQGDYVVLECRVKAYPPPNLQFKKWDNVVEESDSVSIETFDDDPTTRGISLNIANVKPSDYGIYTCEAENFMGTAEAEIELYELGDPVIDTSPLSISYRLSEEAILPCKVTDLGNHRVMWRGPRNDLLTIGDDVRTSDGRFRLSKMYEGEWNLAIRNVKLTDAGKYQCTVSTRPVQTKIITLLIPEPPHIIEASSPRLINTTEGSDIQLECYATGEPLPTVSWYRKLPSESGRDEGREDLMIHEALLQIKNISKEEAGVYVCEAKNNIPPDDSREITVTVNYKPISKLKQRKKGQYIGRDITLQCSSQGIPLPMIIWKRHGKRVRNNWKYNIQTFQDSGETLLSTFTINSLEVEDFGKYSCVALNTQGQTTEVGIIYPLGSPEIRVNDSSADMRVTEGENLRLVCTAEGTPQPIVKWYKVSDFIGGFPAEEVGESTVDIPAVSHNNSGVYECVASNVLGNTSLQITVRVDVELQVHVKSNHLGYRVGDEVILECIVTGSPEPHLISWIKRNDENATWEHMIEIHQHNESLRKIFMKIKHLDFGEFGEYICTAKNIHSSISQSVHLYNLETTTPENLKQRTTAHSTQSPEKPDPAGSNQNGKGGAGGASSSRQYSFYLLYTTFFLLTFLQMLT